MSEGCLLLLYNLCMPSNNEDRTTNYFNVTREIQRLYACI